MWSITALINIDQLNKGIVEQYGKRIKILHRCPFKGWPNRARPSHPFWQKGLEWPCPVRSALKRTPVQDFNSFSIIFYCIISTTYQKIGDLFCPVHISGFSHSVTRYYFTVNKYIPPGALLCCVMRMVFFPLFVGSADICLTRVVIRVFWSMSLGHSIIYCWVFPSSPLTV